MERNDCFRFAVVIFNVKNSFNSFDLMEDDLENYFFCTNTVFISKLLVIEVNVFAVVYSYMSENFIRMLKLLERLV